MIFLYLTFSLLLAQAELTGAMDGTGQGGYSGDRLVQIFYVPFNTQYWREITARSIESRGNCLVASSKSYFGVKLGALLEQAKREGFAGATQYFLEFDDGKIRATSPRLSRLSDLLAMLELAKQGTEQIKTALG